MWKITLNNIGAPVCPIPSEMKVSCDKCINKDYCEEPEYVYAKTLLGLRIKAFFCSLFNDSLEIEEIK